MLLDDELKRYSSSKGMCLTIGVFDGVHLGHKSLISSVVQQANKRGFNSGVVSFKEHPQEVLSPGKKLPRLTNLDDRIKLIKELGVDKVIMLTFNHELAALSAKEMAIHLTQYLNMKELIIGPDFAFGKSREGNIKKLTQIGNELGFSVMVVPPVLVNGEVVSSSSIRRTLSAGDVRKTNLLLGRNFFVRGPVVSGSGRGRVLGFPTANIMLSHQQALPRDGVYASILIMGNQEYPSITNIGTNPTFGKNPRSFEVLVLDFKDNLYDKEIKVELIEHIRNEKKFESPDLLVKQIEIDILKARDILSAEKENSKV